MYVLFQKAFEMRLVILVQLWQILSNSRRLSSERDGKWDFRKLCHSGRKRTLQLLLKNPDWFEDFWSPLGHFSDGPVWDSIWTRKKPSRWKVDFCSFRTFQIEGFFCSEIESRKTILESVRIISVSTFSHVSGWFDQNFGYFLLFPPRIHLEHVFKAKKVAFRGIFHAKVGNGSFWLILNHEKAFEMEIVFCSRRRRNLAQTNAFPYILLNVIFLTQSRIPLFQFHWKT